MSTLGRRVELARKELGLTRVVLASRVKLSPSSLRDLEVANATPRGLQEILPILAHELGKSINWLLTGSLSNSSLPISSEIGRIEASCATIKRYLD